MCASLWPLLHSLSISFIKRVFSSPLAFIVFKQIHLAIGLQAWKRKPKMESIQKLFVYSMMRHLWKITVQQLKCPIWGRGGGAKLSKKENCFVSNSLAFFWQWAEILICLQGYTLKITIKVYKKRKLTKEALFLAFLYFFKFALTLSQKNIQKDLQETHTSSKRFKFEQFCSFGLENECMICSNPLTSSCLIK